MKDQIEKIRKNSLMKTLWPWLVITAGCVLSAIGYTMFIIPSNMMEGGVTGIGILVYQFTGLPVVGLTSIVLTFITFIIGMKIMGKGFGAKSIYATVLLNLLIDGLQMLHIPRATTDIMLSSFYGGVIVGLGLGIVYVTGAATGGADAVCQMLYKLKGYPIGKTLFVIDLFIMAIAIFKVGPDKIMYSLLFIYIEIRLIDMVMNGIKASQKLIIISDKYDDIRDVLMTKIERGATLLEGVGAYTGKKRTVLMTVIPKSNVPEVKKVVADIDKDAFVVVENIDTVYGEGFLPLNHSK